MSKHNIQARLGMENERVDAGRNSRTCLAKLTYQARTGTGNHTTSNRIGNGNHAVQYSTLHGSCSVCSEMLLLLLLSSMMIMCY